MKKKKFSAGETLVETLAALLLVVLSGILFLQMTLTSAQISADVRELDALYRQAVQTAEAQSTPHSGTGEIRVSTRTYQVEYFTQSASVGTAERQLKSYSAKED